MDIGHGQLVSEPTEVVLQFSQIVWDVITDLGSENNFQANTFQFILRWIEKLPENTVFILDYFRHYIG